MGEKGIGSDERWEELGRKTEDIVDYCGECGDALADDEIFRYYLESYCLECYEEILVMEES